MAAMLTSRPGASKGPEEKKRKVRKSAPKGKAEAAAIESVISVPMGEKAQETVPAPGSPARAPATEETPVSGGGAVPEDQALEIPPAASGAQDGQGPISEHLSEPSAMGGVVGEIAPPPLMTEGPASGFPFRHKLAEVGRPRWKELRALLIGNLEKGFSPKEIPSETERFVPDHFFRKDNSVLLSGRAQLLAVDQFTLPKDMDLLKEVLTRGLRLALQSYSIRGALVGEELVDRFDHVIEAHGQLAGELAQERKAREEAGKRIEALKAEKASADAKRSRELETKQSVITNLEAHKSKQSATIARLKDEVTRLGVAVESSRAEAAKQEQHIQRLQEDVEAERLVRLTAQADALSDQRALQSARMELEDMRAAHEAALADVKSLEARHNYVTSEEGTKEVIEGYRHGPVGKVELSLAIKAGYDFMKARLPPSTEPSAAISYPPRVQNCLSILQDLEARGGGIPLGSDEEKDDDEADEEEDDGGDARGDPK